MADRVVGRIEWVAINERWYKPASNLTTPNPAIVIE